MQKNVKVEKFAFDYTYNYLQNKNWLKKKKLLDIFFNILERLNNYDALEDIGSGTKMLEHHVKAARLFLKGT